MHEPYDYQSSDAISNDFVEVWISQVRDLQHRCDQMRRARIAAIMAGLGAFVSLVVTHPNVGNISTGSELWIAIGICSIFIYGVWKSLRASKSLSNEIHGLSLNADPRILLFLLRTPLQNWIGGHRDKSNTICAMINLSGFVFPQPVPADVCMKLRGILRVVCKYANTSDDVDSARRLIQILCLSYCNAADFESFRSIGKYDAKNQYQIAIRDLVIAASKELSDRLARAASTLDLVRPANPDQDDTLLRAGSSYLQSETDRTSLGRPHAETTSSVDTGSQGCR